MERTLNSDGFPVVAGRSYVFDVRIKGDSSYSLLQIGLRRVSVLSSFISISTVFSVTTSYQTLRFIITANQTQSDACFVIRFSGTEALNIDSASVKEIPGYHRLQATGTSMPKYKTGPNPAAAENSPELVTNGTFDTDTTGWDATSVTSSGGTAVVASGETVITRGSVRAEFYQIVTTEIGKAYRFSGEVTAKTGSANWWLGTTRNNASNLNISGAPVGAVTGTFIATATSTYVTMAVDGTAGQTATIDNISVKEIPASAPYIHWLLYDGTDDGNVTPTIPWGTDEAAVCMGITLNSTATTQMFVELSASLASAAGAFNLYSNTTPLLGSSVKGTAETGVSTPAVAPSTFVMTGAYDVGQAVRADEIKLWIDQNLAAGTYGGAHAGTGNFGNYPLYFGRRGGSSFPFNGREYQTVIRNRLLSAAELSKLETFVAAKTGVVL